MRLARKAIPPLRPTCGRFARGWSNLAGSKDGTSASTIAGRSGDRLKAEVAEMVELAPDVILCGATQLTGEFQQKTRTIPIVFVHVADPVAGGLVESLARPGGNITGFTAYESSIGEKWLEVLKEVAPRLTQVAVLVDPQNPTWMMHVPTMEKAAPLFAVQRPRSMCATLPRLSAQSTHLPQDRTPA